MTNFNTFIMIFFLFPIGYLLIGFITALQFKDMLQDIFFEELIPPFWQNYVFAMLILLWPLFFVLLIISLCYLLFTFEQASKKLEEDP